MAKEKNLSHQLRNLVKTCQAKVRSSSFDCNISSILFQDSFACEGGFTIEEDSSMTTNWIGIEDEEKLQILLSILER